MKPRGWAALACVLGLAVCSCATPRVPDHAISQKDWTLVRGRLAALRATQAVRPYVAQLRVGMREPRSGKTFEGRGALAVHPHSAMRMILVGPGGTTALDVWITRDRWKFAIPPADFRRSGGTDPASSRGLPIAFFRWWFLAPLDGRLLSAGVGRLGPTYLLRDGTGTVILHDQNESSGRHLVAVRRDAGAVPPLGGQRSAVQALEWAGKDFTPHAGDHARYVEDVTGLQVEVQVEEVSNEEPDPAAFLDPDEPGVSL